MHVILLFKQLKILDQVATLVMPLMNGLTPFKRAIEETTETMPFALKQCRQKKRPVFISLFQALGSEKRESERKNEGGLSPRLSPPPFFSRSFSLVPNYRESGTA